MDIALLDELRERRRGRAAPPTSAAAPAAPPRGCGRTAWRDRRRRPHAGDARRSRASAARTTRCARATWPTRASTSGAYDLVDRLAGGRAPGRPGAALRARRGGWRGRAARSCSSASTRTSSWPRGCRPTSPAPPASRSADRHPRPPAERPRDGRASGAGWTLAEMREGVIDDRWIALKPKWERFRHHPISVAFAWPPARLSTPGMSYDIHLDDKYGQMNLVDIPAELAAHEPWFNQTLTTVNDCRRPARHHRRRLPLAQARRRRRVLPRARGPLLIDFEDRETVELTPHQGYTVPRGVIHRTASARAHRDPHGRSQRGVDPDGD